MLWRETTTMLWRETTTMLWRETTTMLWRETTTMLWREMATSVDSSRPLAGSSMCIILILISHLFIVRMLIQQQVTLLVSFLLFCPPGRCVLSQAGPVPYVIPQQLALWIKHVSSAPHPSEVANILEG
jgi:hypothetical protein